MAKSPGPAQGATKQYKNMGWGVITDAEKQEHESESALVP